MPCRQHIEEDVASVTRYADAEAQTVSGAVRITAVGALGSEYLIHRLPAFYERHPDVVVELVDSDANLNIARREADIAIRASRPESGDFVIRKLAEVGFAVYEATRKDRSTWDGDWVAYDSEHAHLPEMRWLEAHAAGGRIRLRNNSTLALARAVAGGIGRAILPCFVGDVHAGIRRSSPSHPVLSREVWLLVHRDARESTRVAVTADWLVERFSADAALLQGRGDSGSPGGAKPRKLPATAPSGPRGATGTLARRPAETPSLGGPPRPAGSQSLRTKGRICCRAKPAGISSPRMP